MNGLNDVCSLINFVSKSDKVGVDLIEYLDLNEYSSQDEHAATIPVLKTVFEKLIGGLGEGNF